MAKFGESGKNKHFNSRPETRAELQKESEQGDFLVEGVCEKKGVLRKKKKKKISRLNPLYLATI